MPVVHTGEGTNGRNKTAQVHYNGAQTTFTMKRLIFSLALMLAATFTFANSNEVTPIFEEPGAGLTSECEPVVPFQWISFHDPWEASAVDCTIKGTVTIIFNDGTKMTIKDVSITFVGVSCGQLLRELMSAS